VSVSGPEATLKDAIAPIIDRLDRYTPLAGTIGGGRVFRAITMRLDQDVDYVAVLIHRTP
jgi:hypothetical protein